MTTQMNIMPAPPSSELLVKIESLTVPSSTLITVKGEGGRTILALDVTEEGVLLQYEQEDLPAILKAVNGFKARA